MTRKPVAQQGPQPANLTVDQMRRGIDRIKRRIAELEAFEPNSVTRRRPPEVTALQNAIDEALTAAFGHNTIEYRRYAGATRLDNGALSIGASDVSEAFKARLYLRDGKEKALVLLHQAVKSLEEEIADREQQATLPPPQGAAPPRDLSKVFVVHGHDEGAREAVARFLERLGIRAIILHEQANQGRTVIEKVEANSEVGFAVILLTPDDMGCAKGGTPMPRARQNVLLELGYFIGRLGRKHVCALKRGEVEIPSDFAGVVAERFDDGGGWRQKLAAELESAEFEIDWNKVMRP